MNFIALCLHVSKCISYIIIGNISFHYKLHTTLLHKHNMIYITYVSVGNYQAYMIHVSRTHGLDDMEYRKKTSLHKRDTSMYSCIRFICHSNFSGCQGEEEVILALGLRDVVQCLTTTSSSSESVQTRRSLFGARGFLKMFRSLLLKYHGIMLQVTANAKYLHKTSNSSVKFVQYNISWKV